MKMLFAILLCAAALWLYFMIMIGAIKLLIKLIPLLIVTLFVVFLWNILM